MLLFERVNNAYQRLDTKERFIKSIITGTNTEREAGDAGAEAITSFADAFAAISGNPLVRERFDLETRIRNLERLQIQFEADQSQSRDNLRRARSDADYSDRMAIEIRKQAGVLQPAFADVEQMKVVTADGAAEGRENSWHALDAFIRKHLQVVSQQLAKQLAFDRQIRDVRDRRLTPSLPEVKINGMPVQVEAQAQYRAGDGRWPEHLSDPEIRYSFRIVGTDLWKSGNITTGRGLAESVSRKIAELPDDAQYRERTAETKRRQILELTALQDREFTYAEELGQRRQRLEEVKGELAKSTNVSDVASSHQNINGAAATEATDATFAVPRSLAG